MLDIQLLENCRAVIRYGYIANFIDLRNETTQHNSHKHFIQANRTERTLYDICNRHTRHSYEH